jgi:Cdc6-like AAA superfamily ATPase
MAIAVSEIKKMQRDIATLKKEVAQLKRKNGKRRVATRPTATAVITRDARRDSNEAKLALDIARRAGLLAELPPDAKARAAEWRAIPEAERNRLLDEFFNLKLDKQLSDIIIENRR